MVKFDEIISASLEWTATVLFRPFSPKKWLILTFIALMAGSISGGNSNFSSSDRRHDRKESYAANYDQGKPFQLAKTSTPERKSVSRGQFRGFFEKPSAGSVIFLIVLGVIAGVVLLLVLMWFCSRFYFIFLEDTIRNDASIAKPFKNNKTIGNSFFKFNLVFLVFIIGIIALIALFGFMSLSGIGAFKTGASPGAFKVLAAIFPAILLFILFLIIVAVVSLIVNDFAIIVMFKDKIKFMPAIKKVLSVLNLNKLNFLLYILIKMGLAIVSSIVYTITSLVAVMGLIFPIAVIVGGLYFIFKVMPGGMHLVFLIVVIFAAVPVFLFLWYCLVCIYLPIAVFFRVFSAKFFGRLDSRYNLFKYANE
ncbi:MAG: hypothetical protein PHP17_06660 [Candidatus Omnitrophica bacterium]|nr:hypothetical protein [Candidatus Omnitrophota bacterium]